MTTWTFLPSAALLFALAMAPVRAEAAVDKIKIGVLTDLSGIYSDATGRGSVTAAQMAVDDCMKAECKGMTIEIVSADHQNKADVASTIAREWIDRQGVDVLTDMANASIQLAIVPLLKEKDRIGLFPSGTARLTGDSCLPSHIVHWMWDTYSQVAGVAEALTKRGTKWFLISADYAVGAQLEADTKALVESRGGVLLGSVRHPFPSTDLSSQILTAQGSGADVIGFANAGRDTIDGIKTARDFGLMRGGQKIAAFLLSIMEVRSIGLETGQGTVLTEGFYWDTDEGTRAFSARFKVRQGNMPSAVQAGIYSAVLHYLKSVHAAQTKKVEDVMAKMHELPIQDEVVRNASLRPDGRMVHDYYLFRIKSPQESKGEWDLYEPIATLPGKSVFRPMAPDLCKALVK